MPGLDQEAILALRYDLGVALETAGESKQALDSFRQVYAMNIDYRDVADRIAELQKVLARNRAVANRDLQLPLRGISHNPNPMMNRLLRVVMLLVWLELGLVLILVPWSDIWEANYFLYQYPALAIFANNPFMRGAISGLGIMNVFLALEAFRRRTPAVASRTNAKPIVCYVTDRKALAATIPCAALLEKIRAAVAAGVDWVQIREKDLHARELLALAREAVMRRAGPRA